METMTGGSEKQVAYASDIRSQVIEGLQAQIGFANRPGWESGLPVLERAMDAARANGSARFWLDRARLVRGSFGRIINDLSGDR